MDRIHNKNVREWCDITNTTEWDKGKTTNLKEHMSRMDHNRLVETVRAKNLICKTKVGRPKKISYESM